MRKTIMTMLLMFLSVVLMYGYAGAIGGVCSNCHTMHNSQNGASVTGGAPNNQLLNAGCVACHSSSSAVKQDTNKGPVVLHTTAPTGQGAGKTNAGGDFYWVTQASSDSKGHNVADITGVAQDAAIGLTPPGWDPVATGTSFAFSQVAAGEGTWTSQLTCAGKYGCHGSHATAGSFNGVSGAHHSNTNGQLATANTVGNSFRFLGAIKGFENADWNWAETAATHNEYYGANSTVNRSAGGLASYGNRNTISFLCAECHGVFHGTIDADATSGSPWVRHPTDINLPNSGGYDDYNSDNGDNTAGNYSLEAPVARPTIPASSSATVLPGGAGDTGAIVMCLSCHRAHGSPQADLLRWDYSTMIAGGGATTGCFVCHTDKN